MHVPHLKTAVWLLVIFELWLLLQVPAVGEAIFDFIIGGEVPGTSTILSPTQMMFFLVGAFIFAVGLIFRKEIMRLWSWMIRSDGQHGSAAITKAPKEIFRRDQSEERVVYVRPVLPKGITRQAVLLAALHAKKRRLQPAVNQYITSAYALVRGLSEAARPRLNYAGAKLHKASAWFIATTLYLSYRAARIVALYSFRLWRWMRPHIEQCDRWIERRLRQNGHTAAALDIGAELLATAKSWIARLRSARRAR